MSNPHVTREDPRRWRRARWDEPGTIYFWSGRRGRFEAFSNWVEPDRIVTYATGEHAFQAAKAGTHAEPTGSGMRRRRCAHVMLSVIRAKFATGELRELLLATGDRILAEDSPYDSTWGCRDSAGGYTGQNLLGRALMRVRDELREDGDGRTSTGHGGRP